MQPCIAALKLLLSTQAQPCHHCHSSLASPPIPGSSWDICCPWSWPTAGLGVQHPRGNAFLQRAGGGGLWGSSAQSWVFIPNPSSSPTVTFSSYLGLHLCSPSEQMNSSANIFALLCATPFASPSPGVVGWLQPGSGPGPVPCPVEAGRQFAPPDPCCHWRMQ